MIKTPALTFIILLFLLTGCSLYNSAAIQPVAKNGVLDLTSWQLNKNGPIQLSGEWGFYWQKQKPVAFFSGIVNPIPETIINVPAPWNDTIIDHQPVNGMGWSTYHLRLLMTPIDEPLALHIDHINTAYSIFIDGKKIKSIGTPGKSVSSTTPYYQPGIITFVSKHSRVDIVIYVSNFHSQRGGIVEPITLGTAADILHARERDVLLEQFLVGCIFVLAIYHLVLFWFRKEDRTLLYFGLFCIFQVIFVYSKGEIGYTYLFKWMSWEATTYVGVFSHIFSAIVFLGFIKKLFDLPYSRKIIPVLQVIMMLFLFAYLVVPSTMNYSLSIFLDIFTLLCALIVIILLSYAYFIDYDGAGVFIIGFIIYFVTIINDMLHSNMIIHSDFISPIGLLVFVICQAYVLSILYNNAFKSIELLSDVLQQKSSQLGEANKELKALNQNLEKKVEQRTSELNLKNIELQNEITERLASEEQFRSVSEQSLMGIIISSKGKFVYVNQTTLKILEISSLELIYQNILKYEDVVHPNDLDKVMEAVNRIYSGEAEIVQMQVRIVIQPNKIKWLDLYLKSFTYKGAQALLMTLIDISKRKLNEEKLESLRNELVVNAHRAGMADIAANTLHNVGNSLNSVKTSAFIIKDTLGAVPLTQLDKANQLIKKHQAGEEILQGEKLEKLFKYYLVLEKSFNDEFKTIDTDAQRMIDLVDKIIKVITSQQDFAMGIVLEEKCNLVKFTEDILSIHIESLEIQHINVEKDYGPVPEIQIQKSKLSHVITNLILNASQALSQNDTANRRIKISIYHEENHVCLKVMDNGCGIEPESISKVFNYGFTTKEKGHGYGLHSSAIYMNEMEGKIQVNSAGPGKGATFEIKFPVID